MVFEELATGNQQAAPNWFSWAIAQPFESHFAPVNGANIHYLTWNFNATDKPVLLLVHGFRAHAHWWQYLAPFFQEQYRVIALSFSGMGDSDFRDSYGGDTHSNDIIGLLDYLKLDQVHTVAHSFGGSRVAMAASIRPELFSQLVMVDCQFRLEGEPPLLEKHLHDTPKIYPSRHDIEARFRLMPKQPTPFSDLLGHIVKHSIVDTSDGARWKFDPRIANLDVASLTMDAHFPQLHMPVDVIYGSNSDVVKGDRANTLFNLMAGRRKLVVIQGGYHHLMIDQPTALLSLLHVLL